MNAPLSNRIRCKFSGHDWRTAIGPRSGYYERCRRCYATRDITETSEMPMAGRSDLQRSGRSGAEQPDRDSAQQKKAADSKSDASAA